MKEALYRLIINELVKKYQEINELNADVEVCVYLLKISAEGIYTTCSLSTCVDFWSEDVFSKESELEGSFANLLEVLSCKLSAKDNGCLTSEIGYYEPIIFFFVDDLEINVTSVQKINSENRWFQHSTKIAIPFSDDSNKFKELLGTREGVFSISKEIEQEQINELVNVIYDIRINSITHSVQANFSRSGDICAALFRGAIDDPDEFSESLYDFSKKQQQFKTLVAVDPIEESVSADDKSIIIADDLATQEEIKVHDMTAEPAGDNVSADSDTDVSSDD